MAHQHHSGPPRACAGANGWQWDLEVSREVDQWIEAAEACQHCPALALCRRELSAAYPTWKRDSSGRLSPRAVVWAGLIFGPSGRVLTPRGLGRVHALARRERARLASERRRRADPEHVTALSA